MRKFLSFRLLAPLAGAVVFSLSGCGPGTAPLPDEPVTIPASHSEQYKAPKTKPKSNDPVPPGAPSSK